MTVETETADKGGQVVRTKNSLSVLIPHVNPQPWALGNISVGRKGGKMFPIVSPNLTLKNYQNALREELESILHEDALDGLEPPYGVRLWFWRQIESYTDKAGRVRWRNAADTTNMQKATEDAIQGVLIGNDRDVRHISSETVAQSRDVVPHIVIQVFHYRSPVPYPFALMDWADVMHIRKPE